MAFNNHVLNGYSEVLNRYNLATNGAFRIHQRGTFGSWGTAIKENDYIADCWFCEAQEFDWCEAISDGSRLGFAGEGRKGQSIVLKNKDIKEVSRAHSSFDIGITAAVIGYSYTNDVQITCKPRHYSGSINARYTRRPIARAQDRGLNYSASTFFPVEAVYALETTPESFNNRPEIVCKLMNDGPFKFYLHSFREFPGLFRNPPTFAPVAYSEELTRCERYYQIGRFISNVPLRQNGSSMVGYAWSPLRTTMNGTPSYSTSNLAVTLYQNAENGTGQTLSDTGWSVSTTLGYNNGVQLEFNKSSVVANRSFGYFTLQWVAEV